MTMPYLLNENKTLELHLASVMTHFNVTDDILARDEWVKMFHKLALDPSRKVKQTKKFGLKLAATDPHEISLPHEFNGSRLRQGCIQNAWAGAYVVYGPGWKTDIVIDLDILSGIASPTAWWKNLNHDEIHLAPFLPSEIFSDSAGSMHDEERRLKIAFGINSHGKLVEPKEWIRGFRLFNKNKLTKSMLIKLALTPISVFAQDMFADKSKTKLISCSVTNLWISAYILAGAPWSQPTIKKAPATASILRSNKLITTKPKTHATSIATPSPPQEAHGFSFEPTKKAPHLFLSRLSCKPKTVPKPKADQRKFNDQFYTITTPPWTTTGKKVDLKSLRLSTTSWNTLWAKTKRSLFTHGTTNPASISQKNPSRFRIGS